MVGLSHARSTEQTFSARSCAGPDSSRRASRHHARCHLCGGGPPHQPAEQYREGSTRRRSISPANSPRAISGRRSRRTVRSPAGSSPRSSPSSRMYRLAGNRSVTLRFAARRDLRHPRHRHQREHHDRSRLCEPGSHRVHVVPATCSCHATSTVAWATAKCRQRYASSRRMNSSPTLEGRVACDAR